MQTPAQEVGLMGLRLATRVQHALDQIPQDQMIELMHAMRREAANRRRARGSAFFA